MRKLYKLGPLLLDPESRVLTHEGAALAVGARAVALLTALVSQAGEYVGKAALLDAAWPGLLVEEANLAVQISSLRRALARVPGGEEWIETLARRGYRFVGPVAEVVGRPESASASNRRRTNLPEIATSFVGRERELAQIKQRLPATRLLTLTGMGGIGKTRLAQQAAAEVLDAYRDGVWFVDLAPLSDPTLVPSAVAQVLGVKASPAEPLANALCKQLRTREMLLVLDNCEHVLDGCARLVEALLRETAQVTIVATSRESLHLAVEGTYAVPPLPLPTPKSGSQSVARSEAVQLFVERARQYRPRFDLKDERARAVAEICVRLDGIPLALELAAARVAMLPVEEIARLLDQRFRLLRSGTHELPRHQTLQAMIDWSYELLDDAEKALFGRLSVFAGGWSLAAAEAVCGGEPIGAGEVVYVLIGLMEQSLVVADEGGDRYRMLETVRQYARDRLMSSGEDERWRDRHLAHFLALAQKAEPKLIGEEQAEWLQRLSDEYDNLRGALTCAIERPEVATGLSLCTALQRFWLTRGYSSEGRVWCLRALEKPDGEPQRPERAKALCAAGVLAFRQADYPGATSLHKESLKIWQALGERKRIASELGNLGNVAHEEGDNSEARALHERCLALMREIKDSWGIAGALNNLGNVANAQGQFAAAVKYYEECLAIARELGDQHGQGITLHNLGAAAFSLGELSRAWALLEESLVVRRKLGDRWGIASSLNSLGEVACAQGDYPAAKERFREGLTISRVLDDRRMIAYSLQGLAAAAAGLDGSASAACIWAAAERLREEIGWTLPDRFGNDQRIAMARAAAGEASFDLAWQEGRALTLEQAIDFALEGARE
jgi:non-specific serine/threonine protein kinase